MHERKDFNGGDGQCFHGRREASIAAYSDENTGSGNVMRLKRRRKEFSVAWGPDGLSVRIKEGFVYPRMGKINI